VSDGNTSGSDAADVVEVGLFRGWVIAGACFIITLTLGETFWAFGIFFKPLEAEFHWSRAFLSTGYSSFLVAYAVSSWVMGKLNDQYGPRSVLLGAAFLACSGMVLAAHTEGINTLRLAFALLGLGAGATWSVPTATIQRWFVRKQGFMIAFVTTGVGVGGIIFCPLINYLIYRFGWRNAFLVIGFLYLFMIGVPGMVMKHSPEEIGKRALGYGSQTRFESGLDYSTRQVLSKFSFFLICLLATLGSLSFYILTVHTVPYAIDKGISPSSAALTVGMIGGFTIPGRMIMGYLSEKVGWRWGLTIAFLASSFSMIWLLKLKEIWMLYTFVAFYGISHGLRMVAQLGIINAFFGKRSLAELIGISTGVAAGASALGPFVSGRIYDIYGSYFWVMVLLFIVLFGASLMTIFLKPSYGLPKGSK
jgi:MFS family permease